MRSVRYKRTPSGLVKSLHYANLTVEGDKMSRSIWKMGNRELRNSVKSYLKTIYLNNNVIFIVN
jgi:hypothetical protein